MKEKIKKSITCFAVMGGILASGLLIASSSEAANARAPQQANRQHHVSQNNKQQIIWLNGNQKATPPHNNRNQKATPPRNDRNQKVVLPQSEGDTAAQQSW